MYFAGSNVDRLANWLTYTERGSDLRKGKLRIASTKCSVMYAINVSAMRSCDREDVFSAVIGNPVLET